MAGRRGRGDERTGSRGQTETIGVVLILGMTLAGATIALAFGATALNDARVASQEDSIEQAMTQLDSRSAMVGLGDSSTQRVPLASTRGGGYQVNPDAGWINITHHDYASSNSEVIFNETLGALVYENGDTRIAYQGGGVWVREGNASRMVSPPEFHYRGATLTLPVIRLEGTSGAGGSGVVAEITQVERAHRIYPNISHSYSVGTDVYANPVTEGNITVTVKSDFYQAWADYFRSRTTGKVTVDSENETVSVLLISQGVTGDFEMPADGNSIEIRGLSGGHPIEDFTLTLIDDDEDAAKFANLKWSLWAKKGSQRFELHLRDNGGGQCGVDHAHATFYYSSNNGADYQSWTNLTAFEYECESSPDDFNNDGDFDDKRVVINLTTMTKIEYEPVKGGDGKLLHFDTSGGATFTTTATFDQHGSNVGWESGSGKDFSDPDTTTLFNVTNHYLELMGPDVELTVADAAGNTVDEEASTGFIEQSGGTGQFITFLHITENRVEISLD